MLTFRTSALGFVAVACVAFGCTTAKPSSGGGGGSGGATASTAATGAVDMIEAAREKCIAKINDLRATKGLAAYARWTDVETCVDQEATSDETTMSPHGAWISNMYSCNGNGQNECEGYGIGNIEGCLQDMWDEKDQAGCAGCDACAGQYTSDCPNCDFDGSKTGKECGHYVNMSAAWMTKAACGFSTLSDQGWAAINFSQ